MCAILVQISQTILDELSYQASAFEPCETGGGLAGHWLNSTCLVVTHAIGAGPRAIHGYASFRPDHDYQVEHLDRIFYATQQKSRYVGDWHSHPGTETAYLSSKDIRTLKKIAKYKDAQAPRPVSLVLAGSKKTWSPRLWVGENYKGFWFYNFRVIEAQLASVSMDYAD